MTCPAKCFNMNCEGRDFTQCIFYQVLQAEKLGKRGGRWSGWIYQPSGKTANVKGKLK